MEKIALHSNLRLDLDSDSKKKSILGLLEGRVDKVDHNLIYVWSDANDPSINGHQAFTQFSQTSAYQKLASQTELDLISRNAETINQSMRGTREIVELGPGNNKFTKYAEICHIDKNMKYCGADMSMPALIQADEQARQAGFNITNRISNDWLQPGVFDKVNRGSYWCVGGSVGNVGVENLLRSLKSSSYTSSSVALITYFIAPDTQDIDYEAQVQKLRAMYGAPDTPYSDPDVAQKATTLILKPFEALGFDTSCLQLDVQRVDAIGLSPAKIILGAKVLQDFSMTVDGQQIRKKAGDFMPLIESARFTKAQFKQQTSNANCQLQLDDSQDGLGLALVKLQPKKVSTKIKKISRYIGSVLLVSSLGIGGLKYYEKTQKDRMEKEQIEQALAGWTDVGLYGEGTKNVTKKIEEQSTKIGYAIDLIRERYNVSIDQKNTKLLYGMIVQRMNNTGNSIIATDWDVFESYDNHIINPDPVERFISDNRITLEQLLGARMTPNSSLVQYEAQLKNTYNYDGPTRFFDQVDKNLDEYVSYIGGYSSMGEALIGKNKTGIITHNGIEYFVVSIDGGKNYQLTKRGLSPQSNDYTAQKIVANIIKRGEVNLLAEQVRDFLAKKYTGSDLYYQNGQPTIVQYLTDLYAKGYDLSYLIGGDYQTYQNKKSLLEDFIFSYIIPDIGEQIMVKPESRDSRMADIDQNQLYLDISKTTSVKKSVDEIYLFLTQYTGQDIDSQKEQKMHSKILKILLYTGSYQHLKNKGDIRCWVHEYQDQLRDGGYIIYNHIDSKDWGKKISLDDNPISASQIINPLGMYRCIDGSTFKIGLDVHSNLVAQLAPTEIQKKQIFQEHKNQLIAKYQHEGGRNGNQLGYALAAIEGNKNQIIEEKRNIQNYFLASNARKIINDAKQYELDLIRYQKSKK